MADRSLLDAYLERLDRELPLSPAERAEALEEIAGHVADATADLVSHGVPANVAERRALERLGAPVRLADNLAAAHRTPRDLLTAAGVGLRVTLGTTFLSLLTVLVIVVTAGMSLAFVYVIAGRMMVLPDISWGPEWEGVAVAGAIGLAAYAVGRALPTPMSVAARRRVSVVRPVLLMMGTVLTAWIALTWVNLRWSVAGATLMLLVPAWFALGIRFPRLLPRWFPVMTKGIWDYRARCHPALNLRPVDGRLLGTGGFH